MSLHGIFLSASVSDVNAQLHQAVSTVPHPQCAVPQTQKMHACDHTHTHTYLLAHSLHTSQKVAKHQTKYEKYRNIVIYFMRINRLALFRALKSAQICLSPRVFVTCSTRPIIQGKKLPQKQHFSTCPKESPNSNSC